MNNVFIEKTIEQLKQLDISQNETLEEVADKIIDSFKKRGIIQIFGSGHSYAIALEMVERAGGLFAVKMIKDPALGMYEAVEGVGEVLMRKVDIRSEDVVIVVSHSGINPLPIEVALCAKKKGALIISITSINASKKLTSRHKSRLHLFEIADINLDTLTPEGDAAMKVGNMQPKIGPTSTMASVALVQSLVYKIVEKMYNQGIPCDIRISSNIEGGLQENLSKHNKYADRIYRI